MAAVLEATGLDERRAASPRFELTVTGSDRASMVRVTGPLDIQHTPQFLEQVSPLCAPSRRVVVDLRRADYVDSSGVRGLMELDEKTARVKGDLRIVIAPGSRVERVLSLLRLMDRFHVYTSPSEAWQERVTV